MPSLSTDHHYTRSILIQMGVVLVLAFGVVYWQREFLREVYFENQITQVGLAINGCILVLFIAGVARLVTLFVRYHGEEREVHRFVANIRQKIEPAQGIDAGSLIAHRYRILLDLYNRRSQINHNALASTLMASESSLISFPKFVHNILILTGVFGTIVSLSIALLGASDMISAATEMGGLDIVIHGMSTALSTTMTAIVAYLFFGYFYLRLTDTQTWVITRIEDVTSTILLPRFQLQAETVVKDFADIVRAAAALVKRLDSAQARYAEIAEQLGSVLDQYRTEMSHQGDTMEELVRLTKEGFRLNEPQR